MEHSDNRQGFLGSNHEEVLSSVRVAIIGAGGGGSHLAQQIAHVGFGNVYVFDPDRMTEPNRNRQIGMKENDIEDHTWKVDIAERLMKGIRSSTNVIKINDRWQARAELLRECHVVIGCLDSFSERDQLETTCRRYLLPLIDIGMDVFKINDGYSISGQVIQSMPGHYCMRCLGFIRHELLAREAVQYGVAGAKPQVVWPNGVLASTAIGLAVQLFTPWHEKHVPVVFLEYDGNNGTLFTSSRLTELRLRGHVCTHFVSMNDLGDPFLTSQFGGAISIKR